MTTARGLFAQDGSSETDSDVELLASPRSGQSRCQALTSNKRLFLALGGAAVVLGGVGVVLVHGGKSSRFTTRAVATGTVPPWGPERWGSQRGLETKHETCISVSAHDPKFADCVEKINEAMQMTEGALKNAYNPFMFKERFAGYEQWYMSMHRGTMKFADFQMMIYLHDGDDGVCPKPCMTDPPASPYYCAPNTNFIRPPKDALQYNGISWPEMCFEDDRAEEHVLLIGDWGGIRPGDPANNLLVEKWPGPVKVHRRDFIAGIDDQAQFLVAQQFNKKAGELAAQGNGPRYVLNVGDNFYWGGCDGGCGKMSMEDSVKSFYRPAFEMNENHCSEQFYGVYETMYAGPGINGIPWLSVLGNHDYGGYKYTKAWDLQIAYTWGPSGRWVLPGLYWHQYVKYPAKGFDIDYFFLDSNVLNTGDPETDPGHNLCSQKFNAPTDTNCEPNADGPPNIGACKQWFRDLWEKQLIWLDESLAKSTATWQIIVTHIPIEACSLHGVPWAANASDIEGTGAKVVQDVRKLAVKHGIDLLVVGHRHQQELHPDGFGRWCKGTEAGVPYVITGGGGGIMSEGVPSEMNNQLGYMDMTLTADLITIKAFNQHGHLRGTMEVYPRAPGYEIVDPIGNGTKIDEIDDDVPV